MNKQDVNNGKVTDILVSGADTIEIRFLDSPDGEEVSGEERGRTGWEGKEEYFDGIVLDNELIDFMYEESYNMQEDEYCGAYEGYDEPYEDIYGTDVDLGIYDRNDTRYSSNAFEKGIMTDIEGNISGWEVNPERVCFIGQYKSIPLRFSAENPVNGKETFLGTAIGTGIGDFEITQEGIIRYEILPVMSHDSVLRF